MPQNNTSAGSNRRQERFGVLDITIKRMDSFDERVSMFFSPASPGVLAAHRRLSGLASAASPPPVTEKPYLAGKNGLLICSFVQLHLSSLPARLCTIQRGSREAVPERPI